MFKRYLSFKNINIFQCLYYVIQMYLNDFFNVLIMSNVNIEEDLYEKLGIYQNKHKKDYPTKKFLIDKILEHWIIKNEGKNDRKKQ